MSVYIGRLFHWSPRERLPRIKRLGLMPGQLTSRRSAEPPDDATMKEAWEMRLPYICLGTSPAIAWEYALVTRGMTYDLWETRPEPEDEVFVLPIWGHAIHEVRIFNRIPKSRLVFVGERTAERGRHPG